jgi:hypothetical protein
MNNEIRGVDNIFDGNTFDIDSNTIGEQTKAFLQQIYPSYLVENQNIEQMLDKHSTPSLTG